MRYLTYPASLLSGILLLAIPSPVSADDGTLHIHMISGSKEYKSKESLTAWAQSLNENYANLRFTASWAEDAGDELPDIESLVDADLMLVFARRVNVPDDQLAYIRDHIEAEKPVLGIRTASHAFQNYLELDAEVFGGDYDGHGDDEPTKVSIAEGAEEHPIVAGLEPWERKGKIYLNPNLGPNTQTLLRVAGQDSDIDEPAAWTNRFGEKGRAFYTSLGRHDDFENEFFLALLLNAVEWTTEQKLVPRGNVLNLDLQQIERERVLQAANLFLREPPETITAYPTPDRTEAGRHDYYSEGDYWWPDPDKDDGKPYIRRDGETNPEMFVDHRLAMRRLSLHVPALTAAFLIEGAQRYADHAVEHLRAWFVDEETRMNPDLRYGQAIPGRTEGRYIGIIDTLHLAEVARAAKVLKDKDALPEETLAGIEKWFENYLDWLRTSTMGQGERDHGNNHSTAWLLQAATFADLLEDEEVLAECRERFRKILIPNQMNNEGGFPDELRRTKPYAYALFHWDLYGALAQLLSTSDDNLWEYTTDDGRGMQLAMNFIVPYIEDKSAWPYGEDVEYWEEWPMRHPTLLFAGMKYNNAYYIDLWSRLPADSDVHEVIRNFPVRQPLLWID